MMKKALLVSAMALAASGVASAEGFYVGGGIGGLNLESKNVDTTDGVKVTTNEGKLGFNTELMAGYMKAFDNKMVLGAEVFGNYTTAEITKDVSDTDGAIDESLSLESVYGVRVLPGYQVNAETVAYGILGYARGHFKTSGPVDANASLSGDDSETFDLNGYQLGLGMMTEVTKNISIRTDLIYTTYQNKTFTGESTATSGDTYKVAPVTTEANVAVLYKFG